MLTASEPRPIPTNIHLRATLRRPDAKTVFFLGFCLPPAVSFRRLWPSSAASPSASSSHILTALSPAPSPSCCCSSPSSLSASA